MIDLTRYIDAYERLRRTMLGISTCATRCGCCEMHRRIAEQALQEADQMVKGNVDTSAKPS